MDFQSTISNVSAAATSSLQADGSVAISITLSRVAEDGSLQQFAQTGHYLDPATSKPLLDALPTPEEITLGLTLRDLITVRGLIALRAKHNFPLPELIPESLRPAS